MVSILPLKDDFWHFQADVIPEEQIIAKVMREVEDRSHSWLPFDHISREENRKLNRYELIQFFKAYKYPIIYAVLGRTVDSPASIGYVVPTVPEADIRFQQVGQAQLWYSTTTKQCILWECLLYTFHPEVKAQVEKVWRWLLVYIKQLGMERIYTHDFDPAYPTGYPRFLKSLGFKYTEKPRIMMWKASRVGDGAGWVRWFGLLQRVLQKVTAKAYCKSCFGEAMKRKDFDTIVAQLKKGDVIEVTFRAVTHHYRQVGAFEKVDEDGYLLYRQNPDPLKYFNLTRERP